MAAASARGHDEDERQPLTAALDAEEDAPPRDAAGAVRSCSVAVALLLVGAALLGTLLAFVREPQHTSATRDAHAAPPVEQHAAEETSAASAPLPLMSEYLVGSVGCPRREPLTDRGTWAHAFRPCAHALSDSDKLAAARLKRRLVHSVARATYGRRLVTIRSLFALADVPINLKGSERSQALLTEADLPPLRARIEAARAAAPERAPVVAVRPRSEMCLLDALLADPSFPTPVVLITPGNDGHGRPLNASKPRAAECAWRLIGRAPVRLWFMAHRAAGDAEHAKIRYVPVGFGHGPGIKLDGKLLRLDVADPELAAMAFPRVFDAAWAHALPPDALPSALAEPAELATRPWLRMASELEFMHVCNNAYQGPNIPGKPRRGRLSVMQRLNASDSMPGVLNHFPAPPLRYFCGAMRALVSLSPRGTAPDGFRHMEMLLAGTVVVMPEDDSLRALYPNLPVVFAEPGISEHPPLTCAGLMGRVREFAARRTPFEHERLTAEFWAEHVRRVAATAVSTRR